ncbi:MAG: DUF2240 family protein [Halobacteriaceae archaeon]
MSLRVAVAAPFRTEGVDRLSENEFVVTLSLDRGWLTPDQAERLVSLARAEGLLDVDDGDLVPTFDTGEVTIPEGFTPDESLFQQQSAVEQVLEALVEAGHDKQAAVAAINELQGDLELPLAAAAVLYARRQGVAVDRAAARARAELSEPDR